MSSLKLKRKIIHDMFKLSKELKQVSNFFGSFIITQYILIYMISGLFLEDLQTWAEHNTSTFQLLLLASFIYNPLNLVIIISRLILESITTIKFEDTRQLLIKAHHKISAWMIKPSEYIVFPLKMTLITLYFSSQTIIRSFGDREGVRFVISLLVILDLILSFVFCLIKVTYMTGFKPQRGHFFAKIDGNFEQVMIIILPLNSLLAAMSMWFKMRSSPYRWIVYTIKLILNFTMTSTYFYEIPYFNQIAQTLIGNLIGLYVSFMSIFDATSEDFNLTLKVFAFTAPVYFFLFNMKLKMAYSHDKLENRRAPRILKRILSKDYSYQSVEEIFAEVGVIKANFSSRKKIKPIYKRILLRMNAMKLRASIGLPRANKKRMLSKNSTIKDSEDPDMDTSELINAGSRSDNTIETSFKRRKDLEETIEKMIISHFTGDRAAGSKFFGDNYAKYLKIVWMLKKEVVISELLRTVASMISKGQSFRDLYFYELAKQEMETSFKGYYFKRYLYLKDRDDESSFRIQKMIKIDQSIKKINQIGVDLAYCFKLKRKMEMMTSSICQFVELNMRYITVLRSPSKSYRDLMRFLKKLYKLKLKIHFEYNDLHRTARTIEFIHLVPYFYFMARGINCHRSASNIFKLYKQRTARTNGLINEKMLKIDDVNILSNGVIFKVESQTHNFGKLLNIYGDPEVKGIDTTQLIGQNMDILIMESHRRAHREACKNFTGRRLTQFLGENFKTYLKIPNSCYTYPVSMTIKMMPTSSDDFKFIVGVKFLKNDHKMYIVLKNDAVVDSYSDNMKLLFNRPEQYLSQGIHIKELCPEINNQISIQRDRQVELRQQQQQASDSEDDIARLRTYGESVTNQKGGTTVDDDKMDQTMTEKRSSLDSLGVLSFTAVLSFKNSSTGKKQRRKFEVELVTKSYLFAKFSYTVLVMNLNDDREMRKWLNTNTIKKGTKIAGSNEIIKEDLRGNGDIFVSETRSNARGSIKSIQGGAKRAERRLGSRFKKGEQKITISVSKAEHDDQGTLLKSGMDITDSSEVASLVPKITSFQKMHNFAPKRGMSTMKSNPSVFSSQQSYEVSRKASPQLNEPTFSKLSKAEETNIHSNINNTNQVKTEQTRQPSKKAALSPTSIDKSAKKRRRGSIASPMASKQKNSRNFLNAQQEAQLKRKQSFSSRKSSVYETVTESIGFEDTLLPIVPRNEDSQLSLQEGRASKSSQSYNEMYEEGNALDELEKDREDEKSFDKIMNLRNGNGGPPGGTGSVMNGLDIQTHKKYYVYEDSLQKKAFLTEMILLLVLYGLAVGCSYAFNTYITLNLRDHTAGSSAKNSFFVRFGEFSAESQFFYGQILRAMTYGEGLISKDKYQQFEHLESMIKPFTISPPQDPNTSSQATLIDVTDFETYHQYKIHEQIQKINQIKKKIYEATLKRNYLNTEKGTLFKRSLKMTEFLIEGTEYTTNLNYYQSIIHLYPDRASIVANLPIKEFKKTTKNRDLLFFLKNALNVYLPAQDEYMERDYSELKDSYIAFKNNLIYAGLVVLVGLMLILMILSNVILCIQRGLFRYIFHGYMNITDLEFDDRENELNTLNSVFSGFLEKGCCNDFMGFYTMDGVGTATHQKDRKKDQKTVRRYTDPWYCFNLLTIGLVISLFYLLQIGSSISMLTTLTRYTDEIIWTMNKEYIARNLLNNQLVYYNTIMERIVLSGEAKVYNGTAVDKFLEDFDQKIRDDSQLIFDLSRNDEGYTPFTATKEFLFKIENSSLCEEIEVLKVGVGASKGVGQTLCTLLDSGIAHKGLVQSYFRVTQYLNQIKTEVVNNPDFDAKVVLNDPEFVEFQFTFENVYYPAFLSLIGTIFETLEGVLEVQGTPDPTSDNNLFRDLVMTLNFIMMVYSFIKIDAYMRRVCFSFQLISIFTVLRNISVKLRFLKVYKMNQKQL